MRPIEQWIALIAAMAFVVMQHREKPRWARGMIAGISGGIGYAMSEETARLIVFMGPVTATVIITALIYATLDTASALIADRTTIIAFVRRWLGASK